MRPTEAGEKLRALREEMELLPPVKALSDKANLTARMARWTQLRRLLEKSSRLLRVGNDQEQELARKLYQDITAYVLGIRAWVIPPEWGEVWAALERGEAAQIEPIIEFLEDDPYFDASGYLEEKLIPRIVRLPRELVPSAWIARLQNGVLNRVGTRWGWEFRFYVRLARYVDDTCLRTELERIAGGFYTGPDGEAPARARHILR